MIKNMKFKIVVIFFLSFWMATPNAFAGTFACTTDKSISSVTARLQVEGPNIHNYIVVIVPVASSQNPSPDWVNASSITAQGDTKTTYFFDTKASTTYRVLVTDANDNLVEEIKTCQFKTLDVNQTPPIIPSPPEPNPPVPPSGTNPPVGSGGTGGSSSSGNPTAGTIAGAGLTQEQIKADKVGNGLVPCKDTCDFNDILNLVNNLITFLIVTLFAPIIIILFMYAGYKYLTAEGNPSKIANIKKMVWHIFIGMLLVLCSWLIVKTILTIISSDEVGVTQFLK